MNLTNEQIEILDEVNKGTNFIKINAFAGTGKTTTLVEIAKSNPNKKILYLAFNKAIQEEAQKKFPSNVEVKTTHSLAYYYVINKMNFKVKNSYKIGEISSILNTKNYKESANILKTFEFFCNSDINKVQNIEKFEKSFSNDYFNDIKNQVFELCNKMYKKEIEITHSFYLKLFQLLLTQNRINIKNYDIVMLDEAQDTNDVTISIFNALKANQKIIVGDKHQQIYSFRNSTNAIHKLKGKDFYLTNSFRFNQSIANKANKILKKFKSETKKIKGLNEKKTSNTIAYITRTNVKLIEVIYDLINNKTLRNKYEVNFKTIRNPEYIFKLAINVLNLYLGRTLDKEFNYLKNMTTHKNKDIFDDLEKKAKLANDFELINAIEIVKKYKKKIIGLYKIAQKLFQNNTNPKIYLTTAHTSKGLEFDKVIIEDDFNTLLPIALHFLEIDNDLNKNYNFIDNFTKHQQQYSVKPEYVDEFNLYYVAVTRTKNLLIDKTDFEIYLNLSKEKLNKEIYELYNFLNNSDI